MVNAKQSPEVWFYPNQEPIPIPLLNDGVSLLPGKYKKRDK